MTTAPYTSRYYTSADGLKLHYRDYAGPPDARLTVLCLPGLTRNSRDFEVLAPHLAERYRVLCLEFRGRGLSEYAKDPFTYVPPVYVRDVIALLDSIGLKSVAIVGTSLGGIVTMILSAVASERLLGAVLNDIGPDIDPSGVARIGSYLGKSRPTSSWTEAAGFVKELDGKIYPEYSEADWERMARRRFATQPDGSLRPDYDFNIAKPFISSTAVVDLWPFFRTTARIPALAIRGATSDLLKAEAFRRMKHAVPRMEQVTVPNRGHAPNLDEPAALQAIDAFLEGLPSRVGIFTRLMRRIAGALFLVKLKIQGVI